MNELAFRPRTAAPPARQESVAWVVDLASHRVVRMRPGMVSRYAITPSPVEQAVTLPAAWPLREQAQPGTFAPGERTGPKAPPVDRDEIAARAYLLYCSHPDEHGRDIEDWVEAERQLCAEAAANGLAVPCAVENAGWSARDVAAPA